MSTFGEDLIQSLGKAIAHAKGNDPAIVPHPRHAARGSATSQSHPGANGLAEWA